MQATLLEQGLDLMLFGMGTVFVFLALLVVSTAVMSKVVVRFFPEAIPEPVAPRSRSARPKNEVSTKTLAIIKGAIAQHRKTQDK